MSDTRERIKIKSMVFGIMSVITTRRGRLQTQSLKISRLVLKKNLAAWDN